MISRPTSSALRRPDRRELLGLCAALTACPTLLSAATLLPVLVPDDVLLDLRRFLAGRAPSAVSDYGGPFSRRDVVEAVLIQQALELQDRSLHLELTPMPTSQRLQSELRQGHGVCSATTFWREDFLEPEGLLFSDPVLGDDEFEAGLYTVPGNARALAARSLDDVRQLRVLCNRSWRVDWLTLASLGIRQVSHVSSWNLMPRMLQQGRADLLLAPFQSTPDLSLQVDDVRLVPVPGMKVQMRGTRSFLVSSAHSLGPLLHTQLNAGLTRLRRQGLLKRAYVQSGFINPRVADWLRL